MAGWPFSWAAMDSIHSKARLVWQEEICSITYCTLCRSVLSVWCSVITRFPDITGNKNIFWLGEGSFSFPRLKCKQTVHEDNLWKHAQPAFLWKGQFREGRLQHRRALWMCRWTIKPAWHSAKPDKDIYEEATKAHRCRATDCYACHT